jgi:16S rRNA (cytosine967-C5)-methyltransferase
LNSGAVVYPSRVAPQAWRVEGATSMVRSNANEGMIYLQDEASQLVGHVIETQSGDSVLDVCAAPGSKTTHIAALAPDAGLIVAGDLYSHRLRAVRETSSRMGLLNMSVLVHDADAALPFREESFDRVLVDAPCSGTGTLRRNPEIRWRISPEDIKSLAARQKRILSNSAAVVRRGGRLVYATCSIEKDENEDVIDAFLREHKDFVPVAVRAAPLLQCPDGTLRTWPQRDGVDGFFIAVMERCN